MNGQWQNFRRRHLSWQAFGETVVWWLVLEITLALLLAAALVASLV